MKASVVVRLKTEVLDPQGDAVRKALVKLGFEGIKSVRVGKIVEIEVDAAHSDPALKERHVPPFALYGTNPGSACTSLRN